MSIIPFVLENGLLYHFIYCRLDAFRAAGVWDAVNLYFDHLSDTQRPLIYANVAGSNVMNFDIAKVITNLETICPDKAGIRTPALFIAEPGKAFAMHCELGSTMFCNKHIWGAPKIW